jgi:hypothetical protein
LDGDDAYLERLLFALKHRCSLLSLLGSEWRSLLLLALDPAAHEMALPSRSYELLLDLIHVVGSSTASASGLRMLLHILSSSQRDRSWLEAERIFNRLLCEGEGVYPSHYVSPV